ncbi:hypothetical protein L195_g046872, partial [Trifolium pratense]
GGFCCTAALSGKVFATPKSNSVDFCLESSIGVGKLNLNALCLMVMAFKGLPS